MLKSGPAKGFEHEIKIKKNNRPDDFFNTLLISSIIY